MLKSQKDRPYYIEWQDGKCHAVAFAYDDFAYDLFFGRDNTIGLTDDHEGKLLSQYYFYDSFFVELIQVDCIIPLRFNLYVPQRFLYYFLCWRGSAAMVVSARTIPYTVLPTSFRSVV
ncbi:MULTISPECIES: hypothetical protein [unclassified Sphingobacterium]|uniref:hypothetical protein n=1 Tax=unclassified Sphingobacterium TaxID=2609468 RepID=UPI0025CD6314|nr:MULTISPECIES: hypothetical protein [unclassified Sphingobacterium]